jgi:ubiquitin thioesterase protein OTUB1
MEEFRHQEVEPMYKESDHIHIIAISKALNVGIRVEYMDRGVEGYKDGQQIKTHDFPEDMKPKVFLLYRPGHYDILYPK